MNQTELYLLISLCGLFGAMALAQATPQAEQAVPASTVVTKSAAAIGFQVGAGRTRVDLKSTEAMPGARGQASVEVRSNAGTTNIEVETRARNWRTPYP